MNIDDMLQPLIFGIAGWFLYEFRQLRNSVQSINVKIGVIVEKTHMSERRIDRIEKNVTTKKPTHSENTQ